MAERAPKSLSLQEQAKAIAEPLENVENSIEFLSRFGRRFNPDSDEDSSGSDGSATESDRSEPRGFSDHDYVRSTSNDRAGFASGQSVSIGDGVEYDGNVRSFKDARTYMSRYPDPSSRWIHCLNLLVVWFQHQGLHQILIEFQLW